MGYQSIGVNADCNILLCVANNKVGASSCKSFTFNPATGVVRAYCFCTHDMCLDILNMNRQGNVPYFKVNVYDDVTAIGLFSNKYTTSSAFFSKVYSDSSINKESCVYKAIKYAAGNNISPVSVGDKLGIIGSINPKDNTTVMCNVTYMTSTVAIDSTCFFTIYYDGGSISIHNNRDSFIGYINIAFTPHYRFLDS